MPSQDDPNRLGGLGAVVWELLDHPLLAAELDDAVEAIVGSRAGVAECLAEMLRTELIVPLPDG